jgi:hypothetical protein
MFGIGDWEAIFRKISQNLAPAGVMSPLMARPIPMVCSGRGSRLPKILYRRGPLYRPFRPGGTA